MAQGHSQQKKRRRKRARPRPISQKYRIYPNETQAINFAQSFGCTRVAYNMALADRIEAYKNGESMNTAGSMRKMVERKKLPEYAWLNDVSSVILQQAARHVGVSFENFFQKRNEFPTFKKKNKSSDSATYTSAAFSFKQLPNGTAVIKLAKQNQPLKIVWDRPLPLNTVPTKITVSRDSAGRYYISIGFKTTIKKLRKRSNAVGIDMGLDAFITLDDGTKIKSPKPLKQHAKKLARQSRSASKKKVGSRNHAKAKRKVAKTHAKIADIRRNFHHWLPPWIAHNSGTFCVETVSKKNMMKNKRLAKAIGDAGWGAFINMLEYKSDWYGRDFIKTSRWTPSTKECSKCGFKNQELTLADRYWVCPNCNVSHDRDVNAAKNTKQVGLADLNKKDSGTVGLAGIACGADVKLTPPGAAVELENGNVVGVITDEGLTVEARKMGQEPGDCRI